MDFDFDDIMNDIPEGAVEEFRELVRNEAPSDVVEAMEQLSDKELVSAVFLTILVQDLSDVELLTGLVAAGESNDSKAVVLETVLQAEFSRRALAGVNYN